MVKGNKRKEKAKLSYEQKKDKQRESLVRNIALVLLVIMGLTLISWSMLGHNGGSSQSSSQTIGFTTGLFQNPQTGESYDGAIIDGVQFIFFEDVTQYATNEYLENISSQLFESEIPFILEYVDTSFSNDDARFLISQALSVNGFGVIPTMNLSCTEPTLVFTYNSSALNTSLENCIVFESLREETFSLSNGLAYHLIKDLP